MLWDEKENYIPSDELTLEDIQEQHHEYNTFTAPIIPRFMRYYRKFLIGQDYSGLLSFFMLLSTITMKKKIFIKTTRGILDLRLFMIKFSNMGSGKGENQAAMRPIETACALRVKSIKSPTVQKLVGSIDEVQERVNIEKGLHTPGDSIPRFNKHGDQYGTFDWYSPRIPGLLEEFDQLNIEECAPYFDDSPRSREFIRILRCVADNYGSDTNLVMSETLKNKTEYGYNAATTFSMSSFHLKNIHKQLAENGIFSRSIVFIKHMKNEDVEQILDKSEEFFVDVGVKDQEILAEGKKIGEELALLFANFENSVIEVDREAYRMLVKILKEKMRTVCQDDDVGNLLKDFFVRGNILTLKIAGLHAILCGRKKIFEEDIMTGLEIVSTSLLMIQNEILEKGVISQEKSEWVRQVRAIIGRTTLRKGDLIDKMAREWNVGKSKARMRLEKISHAFTEDNGKQGNTVYWRLTG